MRLTNTYSKEADVVLYHGDTRTLLAQIPDEEAQMIITSPPYNVGKEYEKVVDLKGYLQQQEEIINECVRILSPHGSICWQVGNYVENGEIYPLDILLPYFQKAGITTKK